jgi:hypothetical protein
VEDIDDPLARLGKRGAKLVGEVVKYEDMYRLCYIRGPEGILIGRSKLVSPAFARRSAPRRGMSAAEDGTEA